MVQSIRFRADDADDAQLRRQARAAGFGDNLSAYIRGTLGLPLNKPGRPGGAKRKPKRPNK